MARILIAIVGMTLVAAIAVAAVKRAETIGYDLQDRANLALISEDLHWAEVNIDGRDIIIHGEAPDQASLYQAGVTIKNIWGVRKVDNNTTFNGLVQADLNPEDLNEETSGQQITSGEVAEPLPSSVEKESSVLPVIALVSHERCQDNINFLLSEASVIFESGSPELSTASTILLDELTRIASSCPEASFEVSGHTDTTGQIEPNITLSRKRAESVVEYLVNAGIHKERLSAVGYGFMHPIATNKTAEGRQLNRRIEVRLKPRKQSQGAH